MTHHEWQLICICTMFGFYLISMGLIALIDLISDKKK